MITPIRPGRIESKVLKTSAPDVPHPVVIIKDDNLPLQHRQSRQRPAAAKVPANRRNHFGVYLRPNGEALIFWARGLQKVQAETILQQKYPGGRVTKTPHNCLRTLKASSIKPAEIEWVSKTFSEFSQEEVVSGLRKE